ncbi:MAG: hypothetical protein P4L95_24205 [Rouxiella aceris]|uniref:hypothetical protein n=1 Tax=Rouxiella aceris TaxID=2703884 RepID=UPI0028512567|nr:hypothetical protein [Rouxiella aceris]MDR3434970.1 hypothetical protein [Rouxiella aceris]
MKINHLQQGIYVVSDDVRQSYKETASDQPQKSVEFRSPRVKRGVLNSIKSSDHWHVRLGLGGLMEYVPWIRDINPMGILLRRIFLLIESKTVPKMPAITQTTQKRQVVAAAISTELPGLRRIEYKGIRAYVRPSRQAGIFELYRLDRYNQPIRVGLYYPTQHGEWRAAGLCVAGEDISHNDNKHSASEEDNSFLLKKPLF